MKKKFEYFVKSAKTKEDVPCVFPPEAWYNATLCTTVIIWRDPPPQWAKSGGEAVLLQFSDFTKDPMHDFNRLFC